MPERECSHVPTCKMYALLRLSGSLETWQARYCRADFTQCARYQLALRGSEVPINLMPNGAYLKTPGPTTGER